MSDNFPAHEPTFMVDNPLAHQLAKRFAAQLAALFSRFGLVVHHSHGRHAGYTATDEQSKFIRVEVTPGKIDVDLTGEIGEQVSRGLRSLAEKLTKIAEQIEKDPVFGSQPDAAGGVSADRNAGPDAAFMDSLKGTS